MKKIKKFFGLAILLSSMFFMSGCSTLDYVGEDYNVSNKQTVKTQEDFLFNVYKKSLSNANVKIGISKTPIMEILALYVQIENLSYETPYIFKVEDLILSDPSKNLQFITSNNYLSIWQNQESNSMTAMSAMGSTLQNMSGMTSNYNDIINQSVIQNTAQETNKSAFNKLEVTGDRILKHSVKYSSTISPRRSQYYYFFFEDTGKYPLSVKYKGLTYQFNL